MSEVKLIPRSDRAAGKSWAFNSLISQFETKPEKTETHSVGLIVASFERPDVEYWFTPDDHELFVKIARGY